MQLEMLKGKLHLVTVTNAELWYDGSCAIDLEFVEAAGFREFERIDIYNVNNGERFSTYVILAERGSRTISMNGAAARKVCVGDRVIIAAYGNYTDTELENYSPQLVYFNEKNERVGVPK